MIATVGDEILFGSELACKFIGKESCPIVSLDCISDELVVHLSVLYHGVAKFQN